LFPLILTRRMNRHGGDCRPADEIVVVLLVISFPDLESSQCSGSVNPKFLNLTNRSRVGREKVAPWECGESPNRGKKIGIIGTGRY
jgi:hypothetical protein